MALASSATSAPVEQLETTLADCLQALDGLQALRTQRPGRDLAGELRRTDRALTATRAELLSARQGERRARHQAGHDSLTLLPNRSGFSERLDDALRGDERTAPTLAVLYLDLDGFKPINDRHGHDAGDELLRVVAQRMSRSVRKQDLVCRLGGDEFACIVAEPSGREQLSQIASQLFDAVAQHLERGSNVLIFPEGISHNEPHVVRLKTGAGRMLVGARDRGVSGLTFQAVVWVTPSRRASSMLEMPCLLWVRW